MSAMKEKKQSSYASPDSLQSDTPQVTVLSNENTPETSLMHLVESPTLVTVKKNTDRSLLSASISGKKNEDEESCTSDPRQKRPSPFTVSKKNSKTLKVPKKSKQISKHKIKVNRYARTNLSRNSMKSKTSLLVPRCGNCLALEKHYQNEQTQSFLFIETFAQEKDKVLTEK